MIRTVRTGDVLELMLDHPERRNALTRSGLQDLDAALCAADAPVVYLHGAGEAFCAGADLDEVAALDDEGARTLADLGQRVARALATYDGVVVAGIDGAARGGGVELALACDLRICTPDATFAEPGIELGLFGAWGGTARLPAVVGPTMAADLALTGRVIDAETALATGLVSRVTDDPRSVAGEVATADEGVLSELAALLRGGVGVATTLGEHEERERDAFARLALAAFDDAGREPSEGGDDESVGDERDEPNG